MLGSRTARRALVALAAIATFGALPAVAGATDPSHVGSTLEGCKFSSTTVLPDGNGNFICPTAAYTTGNLGKGWNELDLVPHRVTLDAGNAAPATQSYTIAVVLDGRDAGAPGYDVISAPTLNTALSDAGCDPGTSSGQLTTTGFGGIDESIYRTLTVTQTKGSTCVYDYYGRLALGSHLFPGSSLHANLALIGSDGEPTTQGIGASDVSIPVNEILPQELTKDMSALQNSDHAWSIVKGAEPDHVNFTNTCATGAALNATVAVTVTWTKLAATPSGDITVTTHVYAKNPAARTITVTPTDVIKSGTTSLETVHGGAVDVPANTKLLVLTHTLTVPAGTLALNDVATATYTDKVTGIAIPGSTSATASATVQGSGIVTNSSAVISDSENITGPFSYSADSFTPNIGAFQNGYVAGTKTTSQTDWLSSSQSDSGAVTFSKTVYTSAGSSGSGTLSDVAHVTGSDGFDAQANASVALVSARQATISIVKHIPNVLSGTETAAFTFDVKDAADNIVETRTLNFAAGDTTKSVNVTGLTPGAYSVEERTATGWAPQDPVPVDVTTACSGGAEFTNNFGPATAEAHKISNPSGFESGWQMVLTGPGTPAGGEKVLTGATGTASFTTVLQEGAYTITETNQSGWLNTGSTGECSFTVNYPADADHAYSCTFTNVKYGHLKVQKTVSGSSDLGGRSFTFQLRIGASPTAIGTTLETETVDAAHNPATFTADLVPGTTYQLCETVPGVGWMTSLFAGGFTPNIVNDPFADNSVICHDFTVTAGETKTYTVDNTPPPGGMALTIGYWKTHASCSSNNGKMKQATDLVLASFPIAAGQTTHGVYIGSLYVDTCREAVNLLNKSTVSTGKKMASDPAYNLAAQLMAVELNLQGGAGACGGLLTYRAQAQTLLSKYGFDGVSSYTSGASKMSAADQTLANALAHQLDQWNNNTLC
jgi:hypothetical protein